MLLSYFTERRERAACVNQTIGICSTLVVIAQLHAAGSVPGPVFVAVVAIAAAGLLLPAANWAGARVRSASPVWRAWERLIALIGAAVICQLAASMVIDLPTRAASATAALALGAAAAAGARAALPMLRGGGGGGGGGAAAGGLPAPSSSSSFATVYGWLATVLFMLMPLPQLLRNFTSARADCAASAVSQQTLLLAIVGNGLMIPRALFSRDLPWLVGSSWGMLVMGVIQLASVSRPAGARVACAAAAFLAATVFCQRRYDASKNTDIS